MSSTMLNLMNAIMRPLLRSPFHFLASGWCALITVKGRRTGRLYTTPVYYRREGNVLRFFSDKHRKWIRNFESGTPVRLRLQGADVPGTAAPCLADHDVHHKWLKLMYPRISEERAAVLVLIEVRL